MKSEMSCIFPRAKGIAVQPHLHGIDAANSLHNGFSKDFRLGSIGPVHGQMQPILGPLIYINTELVLDKSNVDVRQSRMQVKKKKQKNPKKIKIYK